MSVAGKQRICFVTNDFAGVIRNGGIGTHYLLMSGLLAARGWDVHVLFCGPVDNEDEMRALPARLAEQGITFRVAQRPARPRLVLGSAVRRCVADPRREPARI